MDSQNDSGDGNGGHIYHEMRDGILWVILTGRVSLSTATTYATVNQDLWQGSPRILWDLRAFDPSGVSSQDILNIQHAFAEIAAGRAGGRSAVLVGKALDLVARVAITLSDRPDKPVAVRSFLDEEDARRWLKED